MKFRATFVRAAERLISAMAVVFFAMSSPGENMYIRLITEAQARIGITDHAV